MAAFCMNIMDGKCSVAAEDGAEDAKCTDEGVCMENKDCPYRLEEISDEDMDDAAAGL